MDGVMHPQALAHLLEEAPLPIPAAVLRSYAKGDLTVPHSFRVGFKMAYGGGDFRKWLAFKSAKFSMDRAMGEAIRNPPTIQTLSDPLMYTFTFPSRGSNDDRS